MRRFQTGLSLVELMIGLALGLFISAAGFAAADLVREQSFTFAEVNHAHMEPNATLAALAPVLEGKQPVLFDADDEQDAARLARLRDELHACFGLDEHHMIYAGISLGVPDLDEEVNNLYAERAPLSEIVEFKGW